MKILLSGVKKTVASTASFVNSPVAGAGGTALTNGALLKITPDRCSVNFSKAKYDFVRLQRAFNVFAHSPSFKMGGISGDEIVTKDGPTMFKVVSAALKALPLTLSALEIQVRKRPGPLFANAASGYRAFHEDLESIKDLTKSA